jgi:hypothetical protein
LIRALFQAQSDFLQTVSRGERQTLKSGWPACRLRFVPKAEEIKMIKVKKRRGGEAEACSRHRVQPIQPPSSFRAKPIHFVVRPADEVCPICAAWFLKEGHWIVLLEDDGSGPAAFADQLLTSLLVGAEEIAMGSGPGLPNTVLRGRVLMIRTENVALWRPVLGPLMDKGLLDPEGSA